MAARHPSPAEPLDILIVDDHAVFAEVLAMRLETEPYVRSVHIAQSVSAARAKVPALADGLIFLDLNLGDECGLDLIEPISRLEVKPRVVMLSASRDPDDIIRALRAGVDAWLVKNQGYDTLVQVTTDVCDGLMYLPPRSMRDVITRLAHCPEGSAREKTFLDVITRREREVLDCLMAGLSHKELSSQLAVSPNTVRTHLRHLMERAGVHSTVALVAQARAAGYPR